MSLFGIKGRRAWLVVLHDTAMATASFVVALWLRLGEAFASQTEGFLVEATVAFAAIAVMTFVAMGLYRGVWRYASIDDLVAIVRAVTVAVLVFLFVMFLLTRLELMPRSTLVITWLLLIVALGAPRFGWRLIKDGSPLGLTSRGYDARIPVLLVGAGDRAESFLRAMRRPDERYRVVGIVDDSPDSVGRRIQGVRVLATVAGLDDAVEKLRRRDQRPRRLLLAEESPDAARFGELLERAEALGMSLARVPRLTDFQDHNGNNRVELRPVAIEDLLGRPQARLDQAAMADLIGGRRVLVTGAGGTIGGELVRQIAARGPASLALLDSSEHALYLVDREVGERWPALEVHALLADVRDAAALEAAFADSRPELVFHAAALKHVPIAEAHASEAVLTNVAGTRNVADAARAHGVRAMVMVSTDKAVNPSNVMGASKRLAEAYCQALDSTDGTRFVTVRFGNVLGSAGSVVPLFQHQLAAGGPLTVTHPEMTRFFMTTREAVELILQATVLGLDDGAATPVGGIFVLEMGEPVRIVDLARQMIRLAGHHPDTDIAITFIGPRPGEKLHEELFHAGEPLVETAHEAIRLARPRAAVEATLAVAIDELTALAVSHDDAAVRARLAQILPEFEAATPAAAQ